MIFITYQLFYVFYFKKKITKVWLYQ